MNLHHAAGRDIYRRVTGHVLRNGFAVHMLESGVPIERLERMLGASEISGAGPAIEEISLPIPNAAVPAGNPLA